MEEWDGTKKWINGRMEEWRVTEKWIKERMEEWRVTEKWINGRMEEWRVTEKWINGRITGTEKWINGRIAWNSEIDKWRKGIRNRRKSVRWNEGQKVGKEMHKGRTQSQNKQFVKKIMTNYIKITDGNSRDGGGCFT
jgi:hypothetical protein